MGKKYTEKLAKKVLDRDGREAMEYFLLRTHGFYGNYDVDLSEYELVSRVQQQQQQQKLKEPEQHKRQDKDAKILKEIKSLKSTTKQTTKATKKLKVKTIQKRKAYRKFTEAEVEILGKGGGRSLYTI